MGVAIKDLLTIEELPTKSLKHKTLAVDAHNILYQFLTTIRARDGSPLTNTKGHVTSHLIGLFNRFCSLLADDIHLVMVFDGKAPELKEKERNKRREAKESATQAYEKAKAEHDQEAMQKYGARTSYLTKEMVQDAKTCLQYLGIPIIEAPGEAEAQAAHMVKKGDVYAVVTQDLDALLFGAPLVLRNLSIAGRRKKIHGLGTRTIQPEQITLADQLNNLGIDQDGLIALGMLVGTDYNIGGIKGIGPKKAKKLVKEYAGDYDTLFQDVKWEEYFDIPWTEVFYLFKKMPTTNNYDLQLQQPNFAQLTTYLTEEHDFDKQRVQSSLEKLKKNVSPQKGLGDFV